MSKEVMKLALSCIKSSAEYKRGNATFVETAEDIEQALAAPAQPAPVQEPIGYAVPTFDFDNSVIKKVHYAGTVPVYTTPPAQESVCSTGLCHYRKPLTAREIELIDGMIKVQLDHAKQCDSIANRTTADKQKGWDMERVALLQKIRATPPAAQRPWVRLTDEERTKIRRDHYARTLPLMEAVEAKIREKNT